MDWNENDFMARLNAALKEYDYEQVVSLCDSLVEQLNTTNNSVSEPSANEILRGLKGKRYFDQLRRVADVFIQNGMVTATICKEYAQALIDQGELSAAIAYLNDLVAKTEGTVGQESEASEARGLLGRAYKQIYVQTGRIVPSAASKAALNSAIQAYLPVYEGDPKEHIWHGINTAALLLRAEADGIAIDGIDDLDQRGREIAQEILTHISQRWGDWRATMWDSATAMEACVVLGDYQQARDWLHRYVSEPKADAFELGSTLRQLEEVWRLDVDKEPGASLLPILRAELLQRQGGVVTVETQSLRRGALADQPSEKLEKIFGSVRYQSYKFMLQSIDRARAVARIDQSTGQGYGTGFLVRAKDLHQALGEGYLLITNAHVVSDDPGVKDALKPEDAMVFFQLLEEEGRADEAGYLVTELLWTSPPWKLDASILRLEDIPEGIKPFSVHPRLPIADGEQRVYIIGHPKGGSLSFSIQDNLLLDHQAPYLHYRAPTEVGSSGSPVFNSQWRLIGLHHAGSHQMQRLNDKQGTYAANEGIWIQSIIKAMEKELNLE